MIELEPLLPLVQKPARYLGGEWNSVRKERAAVRVAIAFPDVYEIGMSNLGSAVIYHEVNRREDAAAERVYAPWVDMEALLRERGLPLFTLESRRPVRQCDVVGFSLQYELSYTNVLNMLDLAGIPLLQGERGAEDPLVIAGGPCALNAEPLAEFLDLLVLGDGEEVIHELLDALREWKEAGRPGGRPALLARLATVEGIYVPSFYEVSYFPDGRVAEIRLTAEGRAAGAPARPRRRIVRDLDDLDYPTSPVIPWTDVVFDRMMVEVFRGCTRGCRFCHAGMVYRPVRERSPARVTALARELARRTGHHELSLVSLASNDYGSIRQVLAELTGELGCQGINVALPSLRVDAYSVELAREVQKVRRSGLTLAPEAGSQRLRDVINKGVTDADYEEALAAAFAAGWDQVKLYFMVGLPTETDADLDGIVEMARRAHRIHRLVAGEARRRRLQVTVSTSPFVPKPHTPFQWEPQLPREELDRRQRHLRSRLRGGGFRYRWHRPDQSFLEAVLARGDRRLGRVLLLAWRAGCRFDGWEEQFDLARWEGAFRQAGLDPGWYAGRRLAYDETLPWDHLDTGVRKEFLARDHRAALAAATLADCRWDRCSACGVCLDRTGVRTRLKPGDRGRRPASAAP